MLGKRIETFEKLLWIIILAALLLGVASELTGCAYNEVESKTIIDYRFTEAHVETSTNTSGDTPVYYYTYVPETYERLWEITYSDGHKKRKWEECTRFEYEDAKEELE